MVSGEFMDDEEQKLFNRLSTSPKCGHMTNFRTFDTHYECLDCGLIAPKVVRITRAEFKAMYTSVEDET